MAEIRQRLPEKAGRRTSSKYSKNKINIADKRSYTFYTVFLLSLLSGICFYFNWIGNFTATYDNSLALSELPKALVDDIYNKTGWGTMRPQLYFGLKTKHPNSPLFGLLWYKQPQEQLISSLPIRHWCEHGDDVKFSYEAHDGKTFGRQQIVDRELQLQTSWIAVGQRSWSARLTGKVEENEDSGKSSYALVFYLATRGHTSGLIPHNQMIDDSVYAFLAGASQQLGQFTLEFRIKPSAAAISHVAYTIPPQMDMRHVNELVLASLARGQSEEELKLHQNPQIPGPQAGEGGANFAAVQFMVSGNFDLKLHFLAAEDEPLDNFEAAFAHKMTDFDQKFVDAFPIDSTFGQHRELAKRAVASLLGGIGVWHGHALVRTGEHEEPQPYGPLSLLSAVPSRPFFPRGFLWDEGFHNLLIRRFDPELSLQIFASWMDTMNVDGWIPREMILGEEAQAKVPAEFLVQRPSIANPPMFFYVLDKFVRNTELLKRHHHQIARIYPRLKQLYIWLRQTQRGPRPGTMQWQGRNRTTDRELNPKILPSGLDDFPRATHPSPEEYHLDLRCWMALSSRVLRHLAETFGDSDWMPVVEEDMRAFNDVAQLDDLHWSEEQQRYADFGLHSSRVKLVQVTLKKEAKRAAHGEGQQQERQFVRKVLEGPRLRLVDDVFGYVNLFPILLRLLPNDSPKLGILLRSLNRTEDLWTSYGLRSLSTKSPYYLVKNTEHDPPYWRGPVWINMNYLALDALRHYASSGGGPNARLATQLYEQLRDNVVRNIAEQYAKTGFFWEHYNDRTGEGMGTRPFTGWTALVANILAEAYD